MKVLVTGGAGFIGSHIVDQLITAGHDVWVMDDLSSGRFSNIHPEASWCDQTITSSACVEQVVEDFRPDAICHQAAQPSLRRSIDDPVYDATVNIIGTLNLIQAAKKYDVGHFVMASTSAVYGEYSFFQEDEYSCPRVPYGISKAAAELYLQNSGISHTILRYGNVYGPRQVPVGENQLIPHCLNHIFLGKPFVINGDGEQTRDFVYVGDIARANRLALENPQQGIFNCATGWGTSVNRVCELLKRITGWDGAFEHGPEKDDGRKHIRLAVDKAWGYLKWRDETPLHEGLAKTVEAYLDSTL